MRLATKMQEAFDLIGDMTTEELLNAMRVYDEMNIKHSYDYEVMRMLENELNMRRDA